MTREDVLQWIEAHAQPENLSGMQRFAISYRAAKGIPMPALRLFARQLRRQHDLARELWAIDLRETRILAGLATDPKQIDNELLETWVRDFDNWEICDQTIMNAFEKSALAWDKAWVWSEQEAEFVKRAGFVLMARLARADKKAPDSVYRDCLVRIQAHAGDARNFVKKAVNWALREIGKRNETLRIEAITCCDQLLASSDTTARWIARDAKKELEKPSTPIRGAKS